MKQCKKESCDDNDAWVKITTTATVTASTLTTTLTFTSTVSTTSLSVTETTRTSTTYTRTFIGPTTTSTFTSLTTQTSTKSTTTTTWTSTRTTTTTTIPPKFLDFLNISRWWRCEENFTQENLMQNEPEYLGKLITWLWPEHTNIAQTYTQLKIGQHLTEIT